MTLVFGPTYFWMSASEPTAVILSPVIAIACPEGRAESIVTTFPLRSTRSAGAAVAVADLGAQAPSSVHASTPSGATDESRRARSDMCGGGVRERAGDDRPRTEQPVRARNSGARPENASAAPDAAARSRPSPAPGRHALPLASDGSGAYTGMRGPPTRHTQIVLRGHVVADEESMAG